jgi:hypothetical protein
MVEWIRLPTWVETDCESLIRDPESKDETRSSWAGILLEIKAVDTFPSVNSVTSVAMSS